MYNIDDEHMGKGILVYSHFSQKKTGLTRVFFIFGSDSESVLQYYSWRKQPEFFEGVRG